MEKQMCVGLLAVLLLVFVGAQSQFEPVFFKAGDTLVLGPPVKTASITNILWKYNGNLLAEWVKDKVPLDYYGAFKGRTVLDVTTGVLSASKTTAADAGRYTVDINSVVQTPGYNVSVIKEVPQPVVWLRPLTCSSDDENCTLTCNGNTVGAEPVTYSWREGTGAWKESGKDLEIIKNETASVETYSCKMKNPVSEKESEDKLNPFYDEEPSITGGVVGMPGVKLGVEPGVEPGVGHGVGHGVESGVEPGVGPGIVVGIVFAVLVAVGLGVVGYWKRTSIGEWYRQHLGNNRASPGAGNGSTTTSNTENARLTEETKPAAPTTPAAD